MADYSYIGSGKIYLRDRDLTPQVGLIEVGNCSQLNFSVTEDVKELKDFTQPGGGTYNEVRRISAVECQVSMHDMSAANLARALYGAASSVAGGAVTDEAHTVYAGALVPFVGIPAASPAPTAVGFPDAAARANTTAYTVGTFIVPASANGFAYKVTTAGTSAAAPPVFPTTIGSTVTDGSAVLTCAGRVAPAAGTDFEVRSGGLYVIAGAVMAGGVPWEVSYTRAATDVMQALVSSGREYELVFDGLNEARSGKRTRVTAHRVKIGALQNLSLIGEEYAVAESTGKLLKDTTKNGTTISQYFVAEIEA
jgi:hypothetical protein